ncbi:MAG: hypothetical protein HZA93_17080 [Verrucomicrobia bacterium]|nr:hypothetical protein [Verrucomicrobiota bacterium]
MSARDVRPPRHLGGYLVSRLAASFFRLRFFTLGLAAVVSLSAAEWQWSVPMGAGRAFLWIPPDCTHVRAVVIGQNNLLEEGILEHIALRRTLASLGIAEVFIAPVFDPVFQFDRGAGGHFDAMLRALAEESGYAELATAPVVPIGHSACASYPWNFAAWNPDRTLAVVSVKGDVPQTDLTGSGRPNPDWGARTIDGVPGLMVMSEAEWWEARLDPLLRFKAAHPAAPLALLADVGRGHFDASDELVEFLALFIRKAAQFRLPEVGRVVPKAPFSASESARRVEDNAPYLRQIDPAQDWLVDRWRGDEPLRERFSRVADFVETEEAFWCFDEEMARATEAYYTRMRGKRTQQVSFRQASEFVPISSGHAGVELKFEPLADGVTFELDADFIAPLPPKPRLAAKDKPPPPTVVTPTTAAADAHAPGPVRLARLTGPVVQLDAHTFRVAYNRASVRGGQFGGDIWLCAWHPGDAACKSTVQQAVLKLPRHTAGAEQRIAFDAIPDQKAGANSLALRATSSAGPEAKVYFYVREGPAELDADGEALRFTPIPPRAKFPVRVTIVAWQPGRAAGPARQAAAPVEQTFVIGR